MKILDNYIRRNVIATTLTYRSGVRHRATHAKLLNTVQFSVQAIALPC